MLLSNKIKRAIEKNTAIKKLNLIGNFNEDWSNFTRTNFNNIAQVINKQITKAIINKPALV